MRFTGKSFMKLPPVFAGGLPAGLGPRRGGQILLPSLLVIPSLLIFVYLLFETTKISREKIRQQFAVDSAAFIQMGDYTNLFNRTAYVNGPFPYRIFKEKYSCPPANNYGYDSGSGEICEYDILYDAGAFPRNLADNSTGPDPAPMDNDSKWNIGFKPGVAVREGVKGNPTSPIIFADSASHVFDLTTHAQAASIKVPWAVVSDMYMFYAQVYGLLGSVEASQLTVFDRLTDTFNFFRKSYYLNAGTAECVRNPGNCGQDGLEGFYANKLKEGPNGVMRHYIHKIQFHAKVHTGGWPSPYYLGRSNPPMDMTTHDPKGLFQLATVSAGFLQKIGNGFNVSQGWDAPSNYFKVNFNDIAACKETGRPCVHALITTQCPQLKGGNNNCVWPYPTPKYQTRLYP